MSTSTNSATENAPIIAASKDDLPAGYAVTIPDSVTAIEDYAFYEVNNIVSVTIPDSVTSIGVAAFAYSSLESVTIGNSVTSIGNGAFANSNLESVTIGNSVTSIGEGAFYRTNLESVTISDSVTSIGDYAFANSNLESVTIGNSVTSIGEGAFIYTNLESVTIGNSVTSIGEDAFAHTHLESVEIPDSVTFIGDYAFSDNPNLTEVTLLLDDPNINIAKYAFPAGVTIIRKAVVDAGTYTLNKFMNEVATFTLEGTGTLAFSNTRKLTVTGDVDLKGGTLSFADLPTSLGTYTLIDVADGGTLSIDAAVLNQAINDVDAFDGNGYDYNLLQQDNDLVLQVSSVIKGDRDDNLLIGGQNADHLMGHRGADSLFGNQGDDLLDGGMGDDVLVGGDGADTLIGRKGSDTFLFTSDQGIDIIRDFTDQDRIVIDASELGGVIVNPVYDPSTGELSVTRHTFEMQITYGQMGRLAGGGIRRQVLVEEDITLAVLENPSEFDVDTDVSIVA